MKRIYQYIYLAIAVSFLAACTSQEITPKPQPKPKSSPYQTYLANIKDIKIATGQTIYVPVYSHIYYLNQQNAYYLAANLSIRNTDLTNSIIITSIKYYDTNGQLVREYSGLPLKLAPLASTDFFIEQRDPSGGVGANFLVEWIAEEKVSEPIVEAVMIGTAGTQGISFVSPGKVIQTKTPTVDR
ncbi:MAG: DUF3124 domain-containing protein [Prochloraceae cyanobacterium]